MKFPEVLNGVYIFMLSKRIRLEEIVEKVKVCLCLVGGVPMVNFCEVL